MKKILCVFMAVLMVVFSACAKEEPPAEKFTVTIKDVENGYIYVSKSEAESGEEVEVTFGANEGYQMDQLLVNGAPALLAEGQNKLTLTVTENIELALVTSEILKNVPPEGMYFSEITGLPIDESLRDQRPIIAMIDNETIAYPHYGIAESDLVYEMMNSTHNGRITRLFCMVKDWEKIEMMGSIRSSRPTNIILAGEWNAVQCHDGGPRYVNEYFAKNYAWEHFSATFSRVNNGKAYEFTEYILKGDLDRNFSNTGYSKTYNQYKPEGEHFQFVDYETERDLNEDGKGIPASTIALPFPHNESTLKYNESTGTYDYYCYGKLHRDAEDDEVLTFKNVIVYECSFYEYDSKGYMIYNIVGNSGEGYYLTNGYAQKITWSKGGNDTDITHYYDENGDEIVLNRGKIYIGIIPSDSWGNVSMK